jgi:hypothetical protein
MRYTTYLLLFSLVALQLFSSCGALSKALVKPHITKEKGAIPPDYGKDGEVLLIMLKDRKGYNKAMKKAAEKWYNGPYELVTNDQLGDGKYDDVDKYRYRLYMEEVTKSTSTYNSRTGGMSSGSLLTYQAYIYDTKFKRRYDSPATSSFYKKIAEVYMKRLGELNSSK